MKISLRRRGIAQRNAYTTYDGTKYGGTKTYTETYAPDIFGKTGTSAKEMSKDYYTSPTTATDTPKSTITVTQTGYGIEVNNTVMVDKTFHELIFGTGQSQILATRSSGCGGDSGWFGLFCTNGMKDVDMAGEVTLGLNPAKPILNLDCFEMVAYDRVCARESENTA